MSAHGMTPKFFDLDGYRRWRAQWRSLYKRLSLDIRRAKTKVKLIQKENGNSAALQKNLHFQRVMAYKTMNLLQEAKDRWKRILTMRQQIADQMATFPLTLEDCRTIDFYYNRASNEFAELPMWVLKCRGKTYYLHHVSAECAWSTHERPDSSTRGMMRFRNCTLHINAQGEATITNAISLAKAA